MDRFRSMSTLLAAVKGGSRGGVRKLGMPLATVSRKVSELEAHLRTRLANRTSRRLAAHRCRPLLRCGLRPDPRRRR
jgi:DNA-binding transcriptional LysR family regulator